MLARLVSFLLIPCLIILLVGCGSSSAPEATESSSPYPPLPVERLQELGTSTGVDFIFYELPISMNLHESGSIQRALSHLTTKAPSTMPCPKAIGRVFYQRDGESLIEADIFFAKGCAYFLFMENGKPAFANQLSLVGVQFFQGSIQQATGVLIEP